MKNIKDHTNIDEFERKTKRRHRQESWKGIIRTKEITQKQNLNDRINYFTVSQAFITLKDHIDNFRPKSTCRLKTNAKQTKKNILKEIN